MKKQLKKKLDLSKVTVQHLDMKTLDRASRKEIKGGDGDTNIIATLTPVFCLDGDKNVIATLTPVFCKP